MRAAKDWEIDELREHCEAQEDAITQLRILAEKYKMDRGRLVEALRIILVQFGPYQDGQGAAKYHAINMAEAALALAAKDS